MRRRLVLASTMTAAALGICVAAGMAASPAGTGTTVLTQDEAAPVSTSMEPRSHLDFAIRAWQSGDHRLALRHLLLAHAADPGEIEVAETYLSVLRTLMPKMLESDEHFDAADYISKLLRIFDALQSELEDPASPQPLDRLDLLDREIDNTIEMIRDDASAKAILRIAQAEQAAEDSKRVWRDRWWRPRLFNCRDTVRNGLRSLLWVQDREKLINREVWGEYIRVHNELKARVSNKEWDVLLASAGFSVGEPERDEHPAGTGMPVMWISQEGH